MDFTKEVTKHMDKGMSQKEAYAQIFVDAWRRKHPRKETNERLPKRILKSRQT